MLTFLKSVGRTRPVVPFNRESDRLLLLDFSVANTDLTPSIVADTDAFSVYVASKLSKAQARYGIGGYDEHRTVYSRSNVFDAATGEEPRRLHLGIDIWGAEGTEIAAPIAGTVHSFAFNDQYGDYGATIILSHQVDENIFYSLYGHLSLADLDGLEEGGTIHAGEVFAHFGNPAENGHWPPHLHFQLVLDLEGKKGDYPGVCKFSEREKYLANCPNPDVLLHMMEHALNTDTIL